MADEEAAGKAGWFKKLGGRLGAGGNVLKGVADFAPHLEDEATVEVVGQPGASKKQLYFLGLAAAFALARRIDLNVGLLGHVQPPPGMLLIEYDAADKWVRVTLRYKTSMLQEVAANFTPGALTERIDVAAFAVYSGPKCDVVGAEFAFVGKLPVGAAGIPSSSADPIAPKLPFLGKTILTPCAKVIDPNPAIGGGLAGVGGAAAAGNVIDSPNPKPPGDNRSRGAVVTGGAKAQGTAFSASPSGVLKEECCLGASTSLIPLVFAALTDPGSYKGELFVPPNSGPLGV